MIIQQIYDLNSVLGLHREIFGKDFPIASYKKKSQQNKLLIFIYKQREQLIGYSIIVIQKEINNLYAWYGGVLPKYQGKGLNKQFLEYLIDYARNEKYESITLASSNMRPHMLRLAIKLGFDIDDIKKRNYGDGNKIYFKFKILTESSRKISLRASEENATYFANLERTAVEVMKSNCTRVEIEDVNENGLKYLLNYFNSFNKYPEITVFLNPDGSSIISNYKGKIFFIKKTN